MFWVIGLGWAVSWFVIILIIHFAKDGRNIPGMYLLFCNKLKNVSSCEYDRCIYTFEVLLTLLLLLYALLYDCCCCCSSCCCSSSCAGGQKIMLLVHWSWFHPVFSFSSIIRDFVFVYLLGNTVAFAASIAYTTSSAITGGAKAGVSPRLLILPSCSTIFGRLGPPSLVARWRNVRRSCTQYARGVIPPIPGHT